MYFERSLSKSYGLILVLLLISLSSGFSLTTQHDEHKLPGISFLCNLETMNTPDILNKEKYIGFDDRSYFKKNKKRQNKKAQDSIKCDFSTSSDHEEEGKSPVKSYNQLKGLLEEVDMMVDGWM